MFGISYDTWSSTCRMYTSLKSGEKKAYLQWFPFSHLRKNDIDELCSEVFFNRFVKTGAFVLFPSAMHRSENFLQKSDGSFRDSALVSPFLYLIIQAIGKEISNFYASTRPDDIEVYYAGNYEHMRPKYKKDYDAFFKSLNSKIEDYQYFIKTDLTNFFANINIDTLIHAIDSICNSSEIHFTQTQLLLYKEILSYAGNGRFPLIGNSIASSYLATVVYLDEIDKRLHTFLSDKIPDIAEFKMVRYVDDLYILIKSEKSIGYLHSAYNEIRNEYSSILKKYGLALNASKCYIKPTHEINIELKKSLYDEQFNGEKSSIEALFAGSLKGFLSELSLELLLDSVDVEKYNELIRTHFSHDDIEFTPSEVFNYFVYENQSELKSQEVVDEVAGLVEQDISFISLDPKRLGVMIMGAHNDRAIKNVLNHLFRRHRLGKWNSYDTTTAITYLIQSEFRHIDLIKALETESPPLHRYYHFNCSGSFMRHYKSKKYESYIEIIGNDWKTYYLYFMYCIEHYRHNNMQAYAFYKNYFDRMTAHLAFLTKFDPSDRKPNYKRFYKDKELKKVYAKIPQSNEIIENAHNLRNANPLAHASAGLIDTNDSKRKIDECISELRKLLEDFRIANNL